MIRKADMHEPKIHPDAFIAENATLVGEVEVERLASIWYGAVLRGDCGGIVIGGQSSIEDNVVIHGAVRVGPKSIVGHGAVLHGCTVEAGCLIGMRAVVMDGAIIGEGSLVAAGSCVLKNTRVPPGSLVAGTPASIRGRVDAGQKRLLCSGPQRYLELAHKQLCTWGRAAADGDAAAK